MFLPVRNIIFSLSMLAFCLALIVVTLGAYVRLSNAGLGCPDWPGCYGQIFVPDNIQGYLKNQPKEALTHIRSLEVDKAWKEMIHRYTAGLLGIIIFFMMIASLKKKEEPWVQIFIAILALLVILQVALGMWTVTLLLQPMVVLAHLLVGIIMLAILFFLTLRLWQRSKGILLYTGERGLLSWIGCALFIVVCQISLGAWTSTNYAALACPDFPMCQGQWWPETDFIEGFSVSFHHDVDYEGGILSVPGKTAIHMMHRIGALVTTIILLCFLTRLFNVPIRKIRCVAIGITVFLLAQVSLGIANVLLQLPLPIALAHNTVAVLLLLSLILLLHYVLPIKPPKMSHYFLEK